MSAGVLCTDGPPAILPCTRHAPTPPMRQGSLARLLRQQQRRRRRKESEKRGRASEISEHIANILPWCSPNCSTKQASHNACRSNTSSATRSSNNHDDNKSMRQQTRPSTSSSSPTDFSSSSVDSTYSRSPSASASSSVSWGLDLYPIRIGGRGPGSFGGHGAWRGY